MDKSFEYDEIGFWSEIKLDIVKKYAAAYTTILSKKPSIKKYIYIDAFAGPGTHISRTTGEFVPGSPLNALNVDPLFSELHFIDLDGDKAAELRRQAGSRKDVFIYQGDANNLLVEKVFPRCLYEDYHRALCLLDPYSLNVDWTILQRAGQMGSIEVFYNFMIMDANMNVLWRDPQNVSPTQAERMDKVWGDRSWRDAAYIKQLGLFGDSLDKKTGNDAIAEGFRRRLQDVAGFKYVPKPVLMRNDNGATIYYLFFASPNQTGFEIVDYIFDKYRGKGDSVMARNSSIEWTESTWNPVTGCTKISPGCMHCYAERMALRLKAMGQPNYADGFKVALHYHMLEMPMSWKKPQSVLVNSMGDLFHEEVPLSFVMAVFDVMRRASWHTFQLLTKRSSRLSELNSLLDWPSNVWMGVTVENMDYTYRIDHLRLIGAKVKFLSLEPLLGPLHGLNLSGVDWVIVGGESGPGARPIEKQWVTDIREQCKDDSVPFFFKQWGGTDRKKTGRLLDGRTWDEVPRVASAKVSALLIGTPQVFVTPAKAGV